MSSFAALVARDLRSGWASGTLWLPVAFFLLVATLFPFAVGSDSALLARPGGGVLWIAALLAALLPIDRLFAPDVEAGVLDQLAVRGIAEETVVAARMTAHWIGFALPLLAATLPAAALLGLDGAILGRLALGLAIGSTALAALGVLVAALTLALPGSGGLAGLLLLPLAVPMLVFGAGLLAAPDSGALPLLAASALVLVALTPFAGGAALRAARG